MKKTLVTLARALDEKTKELIALVIAVVERCDECIAIHVDEALKTGATRQLASGLTGGSPIGRLFGRLNARKHPTHRNPDKR